MTATRTDVIETNPRVVYRDLAPEDGGVLLHLDTGLYHGVNPLGSMIWHLLEGGTTAAELVEELGCRLGSTPPDLEADVFAFLAGLRRRDLVVG
jgi:hypothetical protein